MLKVGVSGDETQPVHELCTTYQTFELCRDIMSSVKQRRLNPVDSERTWAPQGEVGSRSRTPVRGRNPPPRILKLPGVGREASDIAATHP